MPNHYLCYWNRSNAKRQFNLRENDAQLIELRHAAGEQLKKVKRSDVLWIVTTNDNNQLILLGRLVVARKMGQSAAERALKTSDLWESDYHVLADESAVKPSVKRDITSIAPTLRFVTKGNDRLDTDGSRVRAQQMQSIRTLTTESVKALERAISGAPQSSSDVSSVAKPMVFFNIGWMEKYEGLLNDAIRGGGRFVKERGYGHEMFNFKPSNGSYYGFVQPRGDRITLEKLGARPNADHVDGVLVVWTARHPKVGSCVVGWYDNATVYRTWQFAPVAAGRSYEGREFEYLARAMQEDCRLLTIDERVLHVPRGKKGGMGISNVWYAIGPIGDAFKQEVLNFKNSGAIPEVAGTANGAGIARQSDPFKKKAVEEKAIELTVQYYRRFGYAIASVEKDNVGWDLEAALDRNLLKLEVKGLSGMTLSIELTPNEYAMSKEHLDNYRICVVTDALGENPILNVFSYSFERSAWEDDKGRQLEVTPIMSARMFLR